MTSKERYHRWSLKNKDHIKEYNKRYRQTASFKAKEKGYLAKYHKTEKYLIACALREQTRKYKDYHIAGAKNQLKNNYSQVMARVKLQQYLKYHNIQKTPCQLCGESKSEAHHINYNNPLKVYCLCRHCHRLAHLKPNILHLIKIINFKQNVKLSKKRPAFFIGSI